MGKLLAGFLATILAVPVGVGAAIFLEEYQTKGWLRTLIEINLSNLAGVPSIVYGILGMAVFVKMFGAFQHDPKVLQISLIFTTLDIPLPFGADGALGGYDADPVDPADRHRRVARSTAGDSRVDPTRFVCTGSDALANDSSRRPAGRRSRHRHGRDPGRRTGGGRDGPSVDDWGGRFRRRTPGGIESPADILRNPHGLLEAPFDNFTALPIQIYNWVSRPEPEYRHVAAAAILVLLAVLQVFNIAASVTRSRMRRQARW